MNEVSQTAVFPDYDPQERFADALIHVTGLVAVSVSTIALIWLVAMDGDWQSILAVSIFCLGLVSSFSMSASYNMVRRESLKAILRRFDHAAIYLLIAGAYTPISALVIGGEVGFWLLVYVWSLSIVGIALPFASPKFASKAPLLPYVLISWSMVWVANSLYTRMSGEGLLLLATCSVLYMVGILFHRWETLRFHNAIWHGCVLIATAFLYASILNEVH